MNHDYTETGWEKIEATVGFLVLIILVVGGAILIWPQ